MHCGKDSAKLSDEEISERLTRLDGWSRGEGCIEKKFHFKNFLRAMLFVNAVAYAAESLNHHPDILIHYTEVTIRNWTHAADGITHHDFALAERIDSLSPNRP
jgi:4a-hydroxytetrahydrobiopterin dehydratase